MTHGWWESFKRRHPQLTLCTASPLSYARAVASNPEVIRRYFDLLEQTVLENGLANKPSQIFNLDETGMPLDPKPLSVVAKKGQKYPAAVGSGDKSQIIVLSCCNAAGYAMPPLLFSIAKILDQSIQLGKYLEHCMVSPRMDGLIQNSLSCGLIITF